MRYLGARAAEFAMEAADRREADGDRSGRLLQAVIDVGRLPLGFAKWRRHKGRRR